MGRMLGKLAPRHDPRTLMLAHYLPAKRIPIPPSVDNYSAVRDWGMMANDRLGDCTCAAAGHMIQAWTKLSCDQEAVLPDDEIVKGYSAITGYSPSDPSTDQGAVEVDVLNYWRKTGFGGHKIHAWAAVEKSSEYQVKLAIYLFGAAYTGISLPQSAQDQDVWTEANGPAAEPGSWGGHAVPLLGYTDQRATCLTWGAPKDMTWAFWHAYGDEAYACLSHDWLDKASKLAPNHLNWRRLSADLAALIR